MAVNIQPQAEYVVAQHKTAEAKTASGFYLPESSKEKPAEATVVSVGKAVDGIKAGDKIIYKNTYEATEIKQGGEDYVVIHYKNIVATVKLEEM